MNTRPKVLIATWLPWPSGARLAAELIGAGAEVDVACPDFHPVLSVAGLGRHHRYALFAPGRSLARAIEKAGAPLVIPADDVAMGDLQALRRSASVAIGDVIEQSVGSPETFHVVASRTRFGEAARSAKLNVPEGAAIGSVAELQDWLARFGAPAFLKLDGTFGGGGVREMRTAAEGPEVFAALTRRPSLAAAALEAARLGVFTKASAWAGRASPVVSVQQAIAGEPANCSAFAWRGEVLGLVSVVVQETLQAYGVGTVVRVVDHPGMRAAAEAIARRLTYSGFLGLDFIIDGGGRAWVLEINPRPTPISHFAMGPGRDPIAALIRQIGGIAAPQRAPIFRPDEPVALFPHLMHRPHRGPEEQDDLPKGQPRLIRAFARRGLRIGDARRPAPAPRPLPRTPAGAYPKA